MPTANPVEEKAASVEETVVRPRATPADMKRSKRQPPYAVVLHNDDLNTMPFVVSVLRKVLGYSIAQASWLMMRTHFGGKTRVWTGARELAELKAEQIEACGADPETAARGAQPLQVTVEPVEDE